MAYEETNTFGGGTDPFTLAGADWEFLAAPESGSLDASAEPGTNGEYIAATHNARNDKDEITASYVAKKNTTVTPPTVFLGKVVGGYMITRARLSGTNTGNVKLEVTGHKHNGAMSGTAHKDNSNTIVWPASLLGYGSFDPFGDSGLVADQIQSCSYDVSIGHVDDYDRAGNFLCGRSQGIRVEASLEAVSDKLTVSDPSGWKITGRDKKRGNDGFWGLSLRGEMYPGVSWVTGS